MPYVNDEYRLPSEWMDRPVRVVVVGAGGSGSHVIANLAVQHQAMLALGHPHGLQVRVYDHDEVSEANVGRAKFYPADVGNNKASVIVNRINLCFGLRASACAASARIRTTTSTCCCPTWRRVCTWPRAW